MSHSQKSPHAAGLGQAVSLVGGWRNHTQNSGRTHGDKMSQPNLCASGPTSSAKHINSMGAQGMGRSPRSHWRHVCRPARQSAAMSGWVSAASARRALSVSDWPVSVAKGPFGPARLGWLLMSLAYRVLNLEPFAGVEAPGSILGAMNVLGVNVAAIQVVGVSVIVGVEQLSILDKKHESAEVGVGDGLECQVDGVHFVSSAPVIPRRGGQRCAVHVVNVSQRDTSVKRYLQRFETVTSWGVA